MTWSVPALSELEQALAEIADLKAELAFTDTRVCELEAAIETHRASKNGWTLDNVDDVLWEVLDD